MVRSVVLQNPDPLSWSQAVEGFLQEERLKGRRPRTIQLHRKVFAATRKDLDAAGAPDAPRLITRDALVNVVLGMQDAGRKPRTINVRLQTLRQFFRYLVARGECAGNPANEVPIQTESGSVPKAIAVLPIDQVESSSFPITFDAGRCW